MLQSNVEYVDYKKHVMLEMLLFHGTLSVIGVGMGLCGKKSTNRVVVVTPLQSFDTEVSINNTTIQVTENCT